MALLESSRQRLAAPEGVEPDRHVIWLHGEHDIATVTTLSAMMADAIARDEANLVVDLSDVDFLDASTIGVLVRARKVLRGSSRSLAARAPSPFARRVLDVCGVSGLLALEPVDSTLAGVPTTARSLPGVP